MTASLKRRSFPMALLPWEQKPTTEQLDLNSTSRRSMTTIHSSIDRISYDDVETKGRNFLSSGMDELRFNCGWNADRTCPHRYSHRCCYPRKSSRHDGCSRNSIQRTDNLF